MNKRRRQIIPTLQMCATHPPRHWAFSGPPTNMPLKGHPLRGLWGGLAWRAQTGTDTSLRLAGREEQLRGEDHWKSALLASWCWHLEGSPQGDKGLPPIFSCTTSSSKVYWTWKPNVINAVELFWLKHGWAGDCPHGDPPTCSWGTSWKLPDLEKCLMQEVQISCKIVLF